MLDNIKKVFQKDEPPKNIAKKRLQIALIYDRMEVSGAMLQDLQNHMIEVLSNYFIIDKDQLELDVQRKNDYTALVLTAPILRAKGEITPCIKL